MWIVTKSDWPVLVNLARAATITYQQVKKYDPHTRVMASTWEQEHVVADCETGEQAKAIVTLIATALAEEQVVLDLRGIDLARLTAGDAQNEGTPA